MLGMLFEIVGLALLLGLAQIPLPSLQLSAFAVFTIRALANGSFFVLFGVGVIAFALTLRL